MKIIILGTAHPYRGGLASFNERLAIQFLNEGHETEIRTFTMQYPGFLFPGKTQFTLNPSPKGIKISRVLNSVNPLNWIKTGRDIKKEGPDILIIKYWNPFMAPAFGAVARIVRKNKKTRVICIFDNVISHERKFGESFLTAFFTGSIDGAIVMSKSVGADLSRFRVNIPVNYNPHPLFDNYGVQLSEIEALKKLNLHEDYSYLLFFGFIREYKGLDILLEAFSDTRLRNRNLKLIVAGEFYEDEGPYKEIARKNNLGEEVIFFDRYINEDEVAAFFSVADIVVQPYKSATQSGVTQIAYQYEKPMLVTSVGGLSELVPDGKCGYVVNPEPNAIAEAIIDFYNNDRKNQFLDGIKVQKEKFTWDKLTGSILDIYHRSVKN